MATPSGQRGYVSRSGTRQLVVMTDEPDPLLMPSFRWFLLASLATIVVAALVAGRISRSLTGPIRASRDVARRIAAGDLDARIPDATAAGRDEVGELVASINSMADNLQRSNALERQFLMSVSHDLRTPLTSIKGYAEALTDGAIVDHQQAGRVIETEADRLERLVGDLAPRPARKHRLPPRSTHGRPQRSGRRHRHRPPTRGSRARGNPHHPDRRHPALGRP